MIMTKIDYRAHRMSSFERSPSVLVLGIVITVAIFLSCRSLSVIPAPLMHPVQTSYSRGVVHSALHRAHISHIAFHVGDIKNQLLRFVTRSAQDLVVVVGVSHGEEVMQFAREGFRVLAFDPIPVFVNNLRIRLAALEPRADVRVIQLAAGKIGSANGTTVAMNYQGRAVEGVKMGRVDEYVESYEEVAVMSVDVQGGEFDVLKGAAGMIEAGNVRSLWVEVGSCKEDTVQMLEWLDERYVLFDFVPWGHRKGYNTFDKEGRESFYLAEGRGGDFEEWVKWLCDGKKKFQWVQTDVLAVERGVMEIQQGGLEKALRIACRDGNCTLRELMAGGRP